MVSDDGLMPPPPGTEQFISTSMCAQEVMNIEEQCAEHFLLQNDRSAEQIQNIYA